jgi:hypothetical protein
VSSLGLKESTVEKKECRTGVTSTDKSKFLYFNTQKTQLLLTNNAARTNIQCCLSKLYISLDLLQYAWRHSIYVTNLIYSQRVESTNPVALNKEQKYVPPQKYDRRQWLWSAEWHWSTTLAVKRPQVNVVLPERLAGTWYINIDSIRKYNENVWHSCDHIVLESAI